MIVVSNGGRLEDEVADAGAEFIRLDVADFNPIFIARAAFALSTHCAPSAAAMSFMRTDAPPPGPDMSWRA